ncbi:Uncharacterized protein Adt_26405 [Abeliophyllum distichum]|uniref:Uncharacterized protein n=1 Tax=Abeliophyllum distichum TaxID=126358 RepID=A0ABD1RSM7_9LAMI
MLGDDFMSPDLLFFFPGADDDEDTKVTFWKLGPLDFERRRKMTAAATTTTVVKVAAEVKAKLSKKTSPVLLHPNGEFISPTRLRGLPDGLKWSDCNSPQTLPLNLHSATSTLSPLSLHACPNLCPKSLHATYLSPANQQRGNVRDFCAPSPFAKLICYFFSVRDPFATYSPFATYLLADPSATSSPFATHLLANPSATSSPFVTHLRRSARYLRSRTPSAPSPSGKDSLAVAPFTVSCLQVELRAHREYECLTQLHRLL